MTTRKLSPLKLLMEGDLTRIHDASVKVLEETGMVFQKREALEIFKKHGAKVSGNTVYIPRKMIENALAQCPRTVKWRARNEEKSIEVGRGFHVQAGGGSVYIQDADHGRRKSKLVDFTNMQKLYQSSDVIDVVGFTPVDASDLNPECKHLHMQHAILFNTDKPIHGHVCGGKKAGQMLDMAEIAFGEEGLMKNHHVMGLSINTISPLGFGEEQIDTLMEYVSRNQIIIAAPLAIGGVSAPLSHVGMTVLVNAEILAMIVLVQLLNPGNPIITGPSSSFADMKTGAYCAASPDGMLHLITHIQLSRDLYRLPTRVLGGACDSKAVDAQAGFETMQNLMLSIFAGSDMIAHASGVLDGLMTISYEKMIIDEELVRRARYLITRPVEVSDRELSVDVIGEVSPGGSYLLHHSVYEKCRDLFQPGVSGCSNFGEQQGSSDIMMQANKTFKDRLAKAPETLLDPVVDLELRSYMDRLMNS
ncbi:MAG: trimethylamine methyltransferase family protein [Bacillota bacterium]